MANAFGTRVAFETASMQWSWSGKPRQNKNEEKGK